MDGEVCLAQCCYLYFIIIVTYFFGLQVEFVHGNLYHQEADNINGLVPENSEVDHHPNNIMLPIYDNPEVQPPQRNHRRKGIPHRSPLH